MRGEGLPPCRDPQRRAAARETPFQAGGKAASSGAVVARTRETGAGRSELAKAMRTDWIGPPWGLGSNGGCGAARRARRGWRLLERRGMGEDRPRESVETTATGGAEGQVEVVAVYRGPGRWPTGRLWMDKFS
jgi:hypothetical protein